MKALARTGEAEGLWLRADRQTIGRGRQGRPWQSPSGNLYASTIVRLCDGDPPAASLALVVSLAVFDAVETYVPPQIAADREHGLVLKWPNDVLIDGAKIAGILLEREGDCVVIGTGVNLAYHPLGLDRAATSLAAHGATPLADLFIRDLAESFARRLKVWRDEGLAALRDLWLARAHPVGSKLSVHDSREKLEGAFEGLTEDGALKLRLADGAVRVIHAGDVFLI